MKSRNNVISIYEKLWKRLNLVDFFKGAENIDLIALFELNFKIAMDMYTPKEDRRKLVKGAFVYLAIGGYKEVDVYKLKDHEFDFIYGAVAPRYTEVEEVIIDKLKRA